MSISYNGIMENVVTFEKSGTVETGDFVKITANNTAHKCAEDDPFVGVVVAVHDDIVAVQISGFCTTRASSLTPGFASLCVDEDSKTLKTATTGGRACTVISFDESESLATVLF